MNYIPFSFYYIRRYYRVHTLWDGVVAAAAPRIAREHPFQSQPATFYGSVFLNGFDAIVGARRGVAARFSDVRGKCHLIHSD